MDRSINILLVHTGLFQGKTGAPLLTSCVLTTALLTGHIMTAPRLLEAPKMQEAQLEDACGCSFWIGNFGSYCQDILC